MIYGRLCDLRVTSRPRPAAALRYSAAAGAAFSGAASLPDTAAPASGLSWAKMITDRLEMIATRTKASERSRASSAWSPKPSWIVCDADRRHRDADRARHLLRDAGEAGGAAHAGLVDVGVADGVEGGEFERAEEAAGKQREQAGPSAASSGVNSAQAARNAPEIKPLTISVERKPNQRSAVEAVNFISERARRPWRRSASRIGTA